MHETGLRVTQNKKANEWLLYYTAPGLMRDELKLVFFSDRTGHPNLFLRDLKSGAERQLTHNSAGYLMSYQYFDGRPFVGLGKASPTFNPDTGEIFCIQGRDLLRLNLEGQASKLDELPGDQVTAYTHISADGTRLCVPTTDARAFEGECNENRRLTHNIDERVIREKLSSYFRIYDTRSGRLLHVEGIKQVWITHVTYSPDVSKPDLLHYEYEWPFECGIRMLWSFDGKSHRRLRNDLEDRHKDDWVCHPVWQRDGKLVLYYGKFVKPHSPSQYFLGAIDYESGQHTEIPLPLDHALYGHFTEGRNGIMVSDGYYAPPDSSAKPGGGASHKGKGNWLSLQKIDWAARKIEWIPLLAHRSSWTDQDYHPHPIFNAAGDRVYFSSDMDGKLAIYRIDVSEHVC